jgi:hypothetical protein
MALRAVRLEAARYGERALPSPILKLAQFICTANLILGSPATCRQLSSPHISLNTMPPSWWRSIKSKQNKIQGKTEGLFPTPQLLI